MNHNHSSKNSNNKPQQKIDMGVVDTVTHPLARKISTLLERTERADLKMIIIDDEENIMAAIQSNLFIHHLFSTEIESLPNKILSKLNEKTLRHQISPRTCKKLFGTYKVSRIFAIADMPTEPTLETIKHIPGDLVVLDQLTISGNVGAIVRSSCAFDIGAIVLLDTDYVDVFDRRTIRSSRGYVLKLPILTANTTDFIHACKQANIETLVTTSHTDHTIEEITTIDKRLAIIFGSEKTGCSEALMNSATYRAKIPIADNVESLNVSAAASVILYLRSLLKRGIQMQI